VLRRDAARTGGIKGDLLALVDSVVTIVSENDVLAVALHGNQSSGSDVSPSIIDFRAQHTWIGLVENLHEAPIYGPE
jgi:hypothetical protein